jgi:long-subunit fatty acid transport protein
MVMSHRVVSGGLVLLLVLASTAPAQSNLHLRGLGGRAAGLAGAGSASVADASALVANPAMLSRLDRFSLQLATGRFERDPVEYSLAEGFDATSLEERATEPAVFVAWRPGDGGRLGFGLGVHSPFASAVHWGLDAFRRYDTRAETIDLEEVTAAAAWRIGRFSVAAGPRYVSGDLERVVVMPVGSPVATGFRGDADVRAAADASGWGWILALDHQRGRWGAALVARSEVELRAESNGAEVELVDLFLAEEGLRAGALEVIEPQLAFLEGFRYPLAFDLPLEVRAAAWVAPHPRLALHLDLAHQEWSEALSLTPRFNFRLRFPIPFPQQREHDDTLAVRLGAEVSLSAAWRLFLGWADEPSFVPGGGLDPGLPEGDATVAALGIGWKGARFGVEAGFSRHDVDVQARPGSVRDETLATERNEATLSLRVAL